MQNPFDSEKLQTGNEDCYNVTNKFEFTDELVLIPNAPRLSDEDT